jgi:hypothetical protein
LYNDSEEKVEKLVSRISLLDQEFAQYKERSQEALQNLAATHESEIKTLEEQYKIEINNIANGQVENIEAINCDLNEWKRRCSMLQLEIEKLEFLKISSKMRSIDMKENKNRKNENISGFGLSLDLGVRNSTNTRSFAANYSNISSGALSFEDLKLSKSDQVDKGHYLDSDQESTSSTIENKKMIANPTAASLGLHEQALGSSGGAGLNNVIDRYAKTNRLLESKLKDKGWSLSK